LWKIDGYGRLATFLKRTFEVKPGENYFEFPYDWRRDNRAAARRLGRLSKDWLKNFRKQSPNARLILIAHSMGGLVSRYFLECLGGAQDTRALITFGTPYRGSIKALDFISNGWQWKKGPVTLLELTELVRSLTSAYQLLPTYPCYDNGSDKLQRLREVPDVPGMNAAKATDAFKFHDEIKAGVEARKSDSSYLIRPIVGTNQPTLQSAKWNGTRLDVLM
jgi:pimeloyl-ACP methyl ester carboxylesterase